MSAEERTINDFSGNVVYAWYIFLF
uniref:Uncharacterized protein n=1 Tax=Arundo donax TaxID=35708 RepID=A0A0A9FFG7_ARUDO